jgi:membrane protein
VRGVEHRLVEQGRGVAHEEFRELHQLEHAAADRLKVSAPGRVWSRLNAVAFMDSSMQFSALALLCLFPFLTLVAAESGGDIRPALARRLGLNEQAARDLNALMSRGTHAAAGLNVLGCVLVMLGAIGFASTLQSWYGRVYDQPAPTRWVRRYGAQFLWLGGFVLYLAVQDVLNRRDAQLAARVPLYLGYFVVAVAFYWWTQHVLLVGRVRWRRLFPGAVATGVCVTGLALFSSLVFSGQIVSSYRDYGSIGTVVVLLSYLIGFGVCLHLGAVAGQVWNERDTLKPAPGALLDSDPGGPPPAPRTSPDP